MFGKRVTSLSCKSSLNLTAGIYIVRIKASCTYVEKPDYFLSIHSNNQIIIKEEDPLLWKGYLQMYYLDYSGFQKIDPYHMGNKCEFLAGWCDKHLWIFTTNGSDQIWELTIKFVNKDNLKLSKFYRVNDFTFFIHVPPKSKTGTYAKRIKCNEQVKFNWIISSKWIEASAFEDC